MGIKKAHPHEGGRAGESLICIKACFSTYDIFASGFVYQTVDILTGICYNAINERS